ncbi:dihydrofolate reductase [Aequitasia blattaphilus]|uniref:Dihydrofolate reductase n=1 Tax=Aequitasia blattaphilus TaxID=2949332 RepID=A0ABT1E642_9FIRM|nr:dihydrofolate reductase [Aequitasia blattaphilus]MCP1101307.1 dihydrofolate reductase [Aequitasia blattaphilus]MCR8613947.1 dihydrofolate reductase [Aequitasia blattaphilus]
MNLIVAVDKNWGIGKNNKLLVSIPSDMKYFRETTTNKVVVMGRKTLESFPGGKPLPNRTNIVITTDQNYKKEGAVFVHDMEALKKELKNHEESNVFVIGGESVYKALLPLCKKAYITKIDHAYDADTYFPDLDQDENWKMTQTSEEQTYFDLEFVYTIYERIS